MTFDKWWDAYVDDGRESLSDYEKDVARDAWNKALATRPEAERPLLDRIYSTLRGIPEAMESAITVDEQRMQYWIREVRAALELATPSNPPSRSPQPRES